MRQSNSSGSEGLPCNNFYFYFNALGEQKENFKMDIRLVSAKLNEWRKERRLKERERENEMENEKNSTGQSLVNITLYSIPTHTHTLKSQTVVSHVCAYAKREL